MRYEHTQQGYGILKWIVIAALVSALLIIFFALRDENVWVVIGIAFLVLVPAGVISVLFSKLTVRVMDDTLTVSLGLGWTVFRTTLSRIESVRVVEPPWYYG